MKEQKYFTDLSGRKYSINYSAVNECPICHKAIHPIIVGCQAEADKHFALFNYCEGCNRAFISRYTVLNTYKTNTGITQYDLGFEQSLPIEYKSKTFAKEIDSLCPKFSIIYNQSAYAEELGLLEICGMGYRKAIEHLVKAYYKTTNPETTSDVSKMRLGEVINRLDDKKIKSLAFAVKEIGNGEAHTIQDSDYSLSDMKQFIDALVYFVSYNLLVSQAKDSFPDNRR